MSDDVVERMSMLLDQRNDEIDALKAELTAERQRARLPKELVERIKFPPDLSNHAAILDLLIDILEAVENGEQDARPG